VNANIEVSIAVNESIAGKLSGTETAIHKINGKPLYNRKQEGGVWKKVKMQQTL